MELKQRPGDVVLICTASAKQDPDQWPSGQDAFRKGAPSDRFNSGGCRIAVQRLPRRAGLQLESRRPLPGGPPLLRRRRPGTERALRVAVGTVRPGQGALARELLRSLFPVDVARERRHECDEVVELAFLEPEWLDVLIEPGVSEPRSLVVVVEDVPE